ncbi:hypothetical protein BM477_05400 [Boudabousia marimammalium]|uniref:Major facilitator superfamily (MFS) profile domain-containing protein n=1 Tax=Boudabousia marimammalium TaxID=156892 RepID=A0A1Q5PMK5_9ACTO|nr:hypothetical protein BM477_05400 [Boudabousia marimammalium]
MSLWKTVTRWPVLAWASWDFGSAAFNAVCTTFVFSTFLTTDGLFTDTGTAQSHLSNGMALAGVVIALLAPIAGQRADRRGRGTRSLGIFTFLGIACMVAMYWVYPESPMGAMNALWFGIILLGLGNIFFEFASVNYNAMLNRISTSKNRGTISGFGWGSGYFGGIILLALLLVAFLGSGMHWFGVTDVNHMNIRVSILTSALWFTVFALPVLFTIRGVKPNENITGQGRESFFDSYKMLWGTIKDLFRNAPQTLLFMAASAVFRDGVAGIFIFGAIIGKAVFGFDTTQIMIFAIASNVIAGVATYLFGWVEDYIGPKRVIIISLVAMIICGTLVFILHNGGQRVFWIVGLALTAFVGPVQSASRSFLGRVIPPGREGEVFGLYATTGRAVSFLAPAMYSFSLYVGYLIVGKAAGYEYWGILGIVWILLVGLLLLLPVKPVKQHKNYQH